MHTYSHLLTKAQFKNQWNDQWVIAPWFVLFSNVISKAWQQKLQQAVTISTDPTCWSDTTYM